MIRLLETAIAAVRHLAERRQQIAAQVRLCFANQDAYRHQLPDEQVREIDLTKREVRDGKIANDTRLNEMWRRFDESLLR
jgi:hypothetical protein